MEHGRGEGELDVRADAEARGELGLQPPLHAAGVHDDALAGERIRQRRGEHVREGVDELFGSVAAVEVHGEAAL